MAAPADASTPTATERRLAALLADGQERAWMELLFKEYYAPLATAILRVVRGDRAVAEDLAQDVLTRVWHNRATISITITWRAYLLRAGLNAGLRWQEQSRRTVALDALSPRGAEGVAATAYAEPLATDVLTDLHHTDAQTAVAAALQHLPPECRRVFELSRFEELSYRDIAETLAISPKTVENQMGKALRILRQQLGGVLRNLYTLLL